MIKLYLFILAILVCESMHAQDWEVFGPGSEREMYLIDSSTYLIEEDADIIRYSNGVRKTVYENDSGLNTITCFNGDAEGTIYAVIDVFANTITRLLKSTDRGSTWQVMNVYNLESPNFVYFINKDVGFVSGENAKMLRTADGGLTWKIVHQSVYVYLKSMVFINDLEGFAVGGRITRSLSIKTTDGGKTWTGWTNCGLDCNSVFFSSACTGYTTSETAVYKIDRVNNTTTKLDAPEGKGYEAIYFINDEIGYLSVKQDLVGQPFFYSEGEIYITYDGGSTWELQSTPEIIAIPWKFNRYKNKLYMNCGNSSGETNVQIFVTDLPTVSTFAIQDSIIHPSCFGEKDGEIYLSVQGGIAPFEITWTDPGMMGSHVETLGSGAYTILIQDASGFCASRTLELFEPPVLKSYINIQHETNQRENGSVHLTTTGGTQPYTYNWSHSNILTTSTATGLASGTYDITITDSNGCQENLEVIVHNSIPASENAEFMVITNPLLDNHIIICSPSVFLPASSYNLYTLTGQKLISGLTGEQHEISIDLSGIPPGLYFLSMQSETGHSLLYPIFVN